MWGEGSSGDEELGEDEGGGVVWRIVRGYRAHIQRREGLGGRDGEEEE
jgi:hypothetical protein